jgi:branched-subunit amino acid ABC-type transport system permease component
MISEGVQSGPLHLAATIAVYVFMAIVLAIKPQGLFPART